MSTDLAPQTELIAVGVRIAPRDYSGVVGGESGIGFDEVVGVGGADGLVFDSTHPLTLAVVPHPDLGPADGRWVDVIVSPVLAPAFEARCNLQPTHHPRQFRAGRILSVFVPIREDCCGVVCEGELVCEYGECQPSDGSCVSGTGATVTCSAGACEMQLPRCVQGVLSSCPTPTPPLDMCPLPGGGDADCNGLPDTGPRTTQYRDFDGDGFGNPATETEACGVLEGNAPEAGDCDDGDAAISPAEIESCGVGACARSTPRCVGGELRACVQGSPGPEQCNDVDDDCNGAVDDRIERGCTTACGTGTEICRAGAWVDCTATQPTAETCNNRDDDCDGRIDEALTRGCTSGCGPGTQNCQSGSWAACRSAAVESCNGRDDNCNGIVDDTSAPCCASGACGPCTSDPSTMFRRSNGTWTCCFAFAGDASCSCPGGTCCGSGYGRDDACQAIESPVRGNFCCM